MMIRHTADSQGKIIEKVMAEPVCGEGFCDDCGDCLACHGDKPCFYRLDGHRWVVYLIAKTMGQILEEENERQ